jgi:3-oxoisoapionate kinase
MSLLISYYGDDFTGSTDTMEALTRFGVRTALFLDPPTPERLAQFGDLQAVGVAGVSRTMSPAEMDEQLPAIFEALKRLGSPIVHYKLCSTFDSSPEIGSIGRAIDIGQRIFESPFVPLLVATPRLGRYCVFGNLFARSGPESDVFRLDRHPTMRQHPITPMNESDLRLHLSRQTSKSIGLFDILQYTTDEGELHARLQKVLASRAEIVLLDALYPEHLLPIGSLLWNRIRERQLLAFGSSAVENALVEYWQARGMIDGRKPDAKLGAVDQLLALSGSCSPVTARQIEAALNAGFAEVPLQPDDLINPNTSEAAIHKAADEAWRLLGEGRSVIVHSARGPDDPRIEATNRQLARMGYSEGAIKLSSGDLLGAKLGAIGRKALEHYSLRRVAVAGGDTSSYVMRTLGIEALEVKAPFAPAMPFCHAHAPDTALDGLEMIFKGGQTGTVDFFNNVRQDTP